jgi:hypothetical protein
LRAYEADAATNADTPAQPYVPLIYRKLVPQQSAGLSAIGNDVSIF